MRGAVVSRRLPSLRFTSQDSSSVRVLGHLGPTGLALRGFHDRSGGFADCIVPGTVDGFNVGVNVYLEVDFNTIVSSSDTTARIVTALETYFETISSVRPGEDVPLAGIYNAVYPLYGVDAVVVTDLSLRVPIATGDGFHHVYRDSADPGEHVSTGKLPALAGAGHINIYRDTTLLGTSDATTPAANLSGTGVLAGSYFNITSGDFFIKLAAILPRSSRLYVDFYLDSVAGGMALLNSVVETWEIATLGNIYVNNVLVN